MNIVVFGGSGFLGSHVADKLTEKNHNVIIFDNKKSTYLQKNQKEIIGNIINFDEVLKATENSDLIYNFSAIADLNETSDKALETVDVNIKGAVNILEACKINKIKTHVFASSVYVNSKSGGFYKCSKLAVENYIHEYYKKYDLNFVIFRYGSLYGPRSPNNNGLKKIIIDSLHHKKVIYHGNKETMRDYIHVEDAANASAEVINGKFLNEKINLVGKNTLKVYDLLKMLTEILDYKNDEIEFKQIDNPDHYIRTPYSYESNLGKTYSPEKHIDLGQGLIQLIEEVKKNNS
tara:strand:+ start:210 stop:1082 length:873 start_codon:yes stop_codon:yes gene_type:complete